LILPNWPSNFASLRLQPTNPVGERKLSLFSYAPGLLDGVGKRLTAQEDRLLLRLKETDALSWEKIAVLFPSRSSRKLQMR
jgi:hypothetical protein